MPVDMHTARIRVHMPTYYDVQQHVPSFTATAMARPHALENHYNSICHICENHCVLDGAQPVMCVHVPLYASMTACIQVRHHMYVYIYTISTPPYILVCVHVYSIYASGAKTMSKRAPSKPFWGSNQSVFTSVEPSLEDPCPRSRQ